MTERYRLALIAHHAEKLAKLLCDSDWRHAPIEATLLAQLSLIRDTDDIVDTDSDFI